MFKVLKRVQLTQVIRFTVLEGLLKEGPRGCCLTVRPPCRQESNGYNE